MNVYIPLATGQSIPYPVYQSVSLQTIEYGIVPCCTPGALKQDGRYPDPLAKLTGEMASRNVALDLMRKSGDEFAIMQDRDVTHVYANNYERVLSFFAECRDWGIVALPWKDKRNSNHIKMSAIVIRVAALDGFQFRFDARMHPCVTMADDVRAAGYKCDYLPVDQRLIREIE